MSPVRRNWLKWVNKEISVKYQMFTVRQKGVNIRQNKVRNFHLLRQTNAFSISS